MFYSGPDVQIRAVPFQFPMLKSGDVQHLEESMHVCIHVPSISPKVISGYARCCADNHHRRTTTAVTTSRAGAATAD
jgi:hypothetical protein